MFEHFTEKARRVIFFARLEASKLGASAIEPRHLLLGLEHEEKKETARFVAEHPELKRLQEHVNPRGVPWKKLSTSVDMPLTEESKQALSAAKGAAEVAHLEGIGTAELLRGLLSVAKG
jgi:ATP-dependent Clp protease ATP-binding subunit ClpC